MIVAPVSSQICNEARARYASLRPFDPQPSAPQAAPGESADTACDVLTDIARAALADAVSAALRQSSKTGNRLLDNPLDRHTLWNSRKRNVILLNDADPKLRDIAVRETLKRPQSMLYDASIARQGRPSSGYVWEWAEEDAKDGPTSSKFPSPLASSDRDTTNVLRSWTLGQMRRRSLKEWGQRHQPADVGRIRPEPIGTVLRIFVIAHGTAVEASDGMIRRELAGLSPEKLVARLHDDILPQLGLSDDDTLAINFICCNLLGIGEYPGEPASYVGRFCRALHRASVGTRLTLDVSAAPYMLYYRDDSFTKYRLLDPFVPSQAIDRDGLASFQLLNKMRWRWAPGTDSILPDWAWKWDKPTDSTAAATAADSDAPQAGAGIIANNTLGTMASMHARHIVPAGLQDAASRTRRMTMALDGACLSDAARKDLNFYHYRVRRIDEQFLLSELSMLPEGRAKQAIAVEGMEASDAAPWLTRLTRMAHSKRPPLIDGIALFELYDTAKRIDPVIAAAQFAVVVSEASGPDLFPDASNDERNRYFAQDGRLGLHGDRWVSGMFLSGRYRVRYVKTPDAIAEAIVGLATLAASATSDSRRRAAIVFETLETAAEPCRPTPGACNPRKRTSGHHDTDGQAEEPAPAVA